jgi:putative mRNA 3-end processing factor
MELLSPTNMLVFSPRGIYCPAADIYIDPSSRVKRAIITHAHSDHARGGHAHYLAHRHSVPILRHRLGSGISAQGIEYGDSIEHNGVRISLHPAGHIIGSAQVRLQYRGEIWVVSGDYKLQNDGISQPFEPVHCTVFVTESTFALPVYRWQEQQEVYNEINAWWTENQRRGNVSVLLCYALGKAQRVLAHLDRSIGPIYAHETIETATCVLRETGISLPELVRIPGNVAHAEVQKGIVLAPPSLTGSPWLRRLHPYSLGYASGWMIAQGARQRPGINKGFVLSDHADWAGLNAAVKATGAHRILVMHGYAVPFARWLRENGYDAAEANGQS